jgi:hypothetical protein
LPESGLNLVLFNKPRLPDGGINLILFNKPLLPAADGDLVLLILSGRINLLFKNRLAQNARRAQ